MEEKKIKPEDLQYCRVVEDNPLRCGKTKKTRTCWYIVSLLIFGLLLVVLASTVTYLVVVNEYSGQDDVAEHDEEHVNENDEYWPTLSLTADVLRLVSTLNCTQVHDLLQRIDDDELIDGEPLRLRREEHLRMYLLERSIELNCDDSESDNRRRDDSVARHKRWWFSSYCPTSWIGDGWCDRGCNNPRNRYDDGDCCEHTCRPTRFPCGIVGYDCKENVDPSPPSWFTGGRTQLCYQWYPDGDGGQCGGGAARELCAGVGSYTDYYRDDTDNRGGGCRMRWGITSSGADDWFRRVHVCYRWYADGDGGQCGGGAAQELCASVNSFTGYYRDDTDNRGGGCRMSWRLKVPEGLQATWIYDVKLCYQWYPDGNGGQCGVSGTSRKLCAVANTWTPYYRDDTDNRSGGCRMQWGLCLDDCS